MKQYIITDRYIITEKQLQKFFWDESDDDIHIIKEIRSNPYNPQTEPGQRCIHCEVRNDVQFCHYHDVPLQAEREKVLDVCDCCEEDPEGCNGDYQICQREREKLEELRSKGGEQG